MNGSGFRAPGSRFLLLFLFLGIKVFAQSAPLPPLEALDPAVAAQLQSAAGDVEDALNAKAGGRRMAEAYGSLGQVLHAYEFFEPAEAAYLRAARLAPGDARWPHLLGYLYHQTGRLEEAADQFAMVRRTQPDHREATVRLGEVFLGLNRLPEAREQFERAVDVFPAVARRGLGEVTLRQGRFDEAVGHFRAALERAPKADAIHYSLAMAYRGLGRLDEARAHLQRQGPGGIRIADALVDNLQTLLRGERALVIKGRRAYDAGQFDEAAAAFATAVSAAPDSATAHANLGLALAQLGNTARAVAEFETALRLDPENLAAHTSLGMWFVTQGSDLEAIDHLRVAVRQAPDDEQAVVTLSILLAGQARFGDALALLDAANREFPDRTETATTLARLLASAPDRSIRDGRRALALADTVYASSPAPVHGETVALALAELGRCQEAAEWMRRAIDDAARAQDAVQAARLRGEIAKYSGAPCRP